MPTRLRFQSALLLALLATASVQCVAAAQVAIGQPAPSLDGGKWIKGDPVRSFRAGKVYLVTVWHSPHGQRPEALSLVEKMAQGSGSDVVAVCVSADGKEGDEFEALLQRQDVPPNLRVVKDDPDDSDSPGPLVRRWVDGRIQSYPATFLVDKRGNVVFIGDVLEAQELLPKVLSGERTGESIAKELEEMAAEAQKLQADLAGRPQQRAVLGDNAGAAEALDAIIAKYPRHRSRLLFQKFYYLLRAQKFDEAYKVCDEVAEAARFDPETLNELSWFIATEDWITSRDLERAMTITERSNLLSGHCNGAFVDTLARVHFEQGNLEKAYRLQVRAVEVARRDDERSELTDTLEKYRAALPK